MLICDIGLNFIVCNKRKESSRKVLKVLTISINPLEWSVDAKYRFIEITKYFWINAMMIEFDNFIQNVYVNRKLIRSFVYFNINTETYLVNEWVKY